MSAPIFFGSPRAFYEWLEEHQEAGLMRPAGLAAFERRTDGKTGVYSFVSAKREQTRERRLRQLIEDSADDST